MLGTRDSVVISYKILLSYKGYIRSVQKFLPLIPMVKITSTLYQPNTIYIGRDSKYYNKYL